MKSIRTKGENSQLPWKEANEFEDEEFNGFVAISNKMAKNTHGFRTRKLKTRERSSVILKKILKNGAKRIKKRPVYVKN